MEKDLLLGVEVYFVREGVTHGAVTVAANAKPDHSTDPYPSLASVERFGVAPNNTKIKRRSPKNGRWGTRKTIVTGQELVYNFALQEWTEMTFSELLLQSNTPAAGAMVVNTGEGVIRGWIYAELYNNDEELIATLNDWVELTIGEYEFAENSIDPYALQAEVLQNALNAGDVSSFTP